MKKAFRDSIILHASVVILILILMNVSFLNKKESKHIQLSMQVFNNNEGAGSAARGIESSTANVNVNQKAHSIKNAKNVVAKKEDKKEKKKEKKQENKKQIEDKKKQVVKKENKEKEKKEESEKASEAALMAAKGKATGTGAGKNGKSDGAPKSKGGMDGVFSLKEVDCVPKSIKSARPVYPQYAKNMRIEGYVQVQFIVNKKGMVVNPKVVKAEPKNVFEHTAINAVKQWKFQPATIEDKSVNVAMVVKLNFKLDEN